MKKLYLKGMSFIEDPIFMRRFNGWATIFWMVMIIPSIAFGWLSSVIYVSALSLWALVSGHWAAWQAARVEVRQQQQEDAEEEKVRDMIQRIIDGVDKITPNPDNKE